MICREGFVEILHFEGGRILPSVGNFNSIQFNFIRKL